MLKFGVIGYGYWGPNIVRNLSSIDGCTVTVICDPSPAARARAERAHPGVRVINDSAELVSDPEIDAVAVITPVWTHYELSKAALTNGKHVFVEKPFTSNSAQAEELIDLANRKNLKLMVDHTFLFTGAVRKIKALLEKDDNIDTIDSLASKEAVRQYQAALVERALVPDDPDRVKAKFQLLIDAGLIPEYRQRLEKMLLARAAFSMRAGQSASRSP